ncbi:MAG: hypothetical protein BGO89_11970 [Candidatus Kapaibacterium thiocyanatum]|uniref:Uncharacterized protein n=1 Tax=Candidatus Kapaibacterium thiocyanatum TaxID=1895771 RepID=A0A1M3KXV1_9BACT|nr:MAG: hypothetical protein BGO89_11970 ['Candidatus Kapabacteria' thiocyanatum]
MIGVPVSASREQRVELLDSPDAKFDPSLFPPGSVEYVDGGRGIVTGRDDIPDRTDVRMAFRIGLHYDIPFGSMFAMSTPSAWPT